MEKKDITSLADIQLLVDTFYGRVREDALIGPIFNNLLAGRWEDHLKKCIVFGKLSCWKSILTLEVHFRHMLLWLLLMCILMLG
ncbi:hypothetical protein [Sphingobacterium sp. IITKGP-BTPF85]|uniref:hypothetical protein n=1 Tax=Sphingobacterium sp. IITKGP-BTPF85 TaxID=1338009 RepID=UPI001E3D2EB5|nr:hypothetical protein [Sphingobacterium sp. IITKGP-BTPF85]